jgi:malonyl-CoA O-methyltransferase
MTTLIDPARGYALWAERYLPRAHNELMCVEEAAMARLWRPLTFDRVLDLGTGTGRNLRLLDERASKRVGLDSSIAMLKRRDAPGALFVSGDATDIPFAAQSFDLVLSSLMAGDLPDLSRFTRESARVLRKGGSLVYSDFHPIWAERGWERTFESAGGRTYRIPYHPHTLSDHRAGIERAKLEISALEEPRLGEHPALVVLHAVKR